MVGSGPAGLGAAFALATAGHEVTLLEGEECLGGVLRTGIPAYRLPEEVLDRDISRILALGVSARTGTFLDAKGVAGLAATHDAVILAAGLPRLTGLDAPGVDLPGVLQGIRFLDDVKRGAAPRLSGAVVVVGGGNTAIDCARTALRLGAASVSIAYRRGRKEMPAIGPEIDEAVAEGVKLLLHRQPVRVGGEGRVQSLELAEVELGEPDGSGRRRPVVTGRTCTIPCDALLLALGQSADLSIVPGAPQRLHRGRHGHRRRHGDPCAGERAAGGGAGARGAGRRAGAGRGAPPGRGPGRPRPTCASATSRWRCRTPSATAAGRAARWDSTR